MSRNRNNPQLARLRRERIRRQKHEERQAPFVAEDPPPAGPAHPFATERHIRGIHALLGDEKFESVDQLNARLAEINAGGRIAETASAWKRNDPKWRAQELAYDALEADTVDKAMLLAHQALKLDPDCTDASRLMASLLPVELDNKIHLMREVVATAERNMGEEFIAKTQGHFWGEINTRPYMRAKLHLAELVAQAGNWQEAVVHYERMMELNPDDNLGVRHVLLWLYLAVNRPADCAALLDRFAAEAAVLGAMAWARVVERWLTSGRKDTEAALEQARRVNRYFEPYLNGTRPIPKVVPDYFRPGDRTEAQVHATNAAPALQAHPGFREWLRGQTA